MTDNGFAMRNLVCALLLMLPVVSVAGAEGFGCTDLQGCKSQCRAGAEEACTDLALAYFQGTLGLQRDPAEGFHWLEKACAENSAYACVALVAGRPFDDPSMGTGALPDRLLQRACVAGADRICDILELERRCRRGDGDACVHAANEHLRGYDPLLRGGSGPLVNKPRALYFLRQACDAGIASACETAGNAFRQGNAWTRDDEQANRAWERGCELGSPHACNSLGHAALVGIGRAPSIPDAMRAYARHCGRFGPDCLEEPFPRFGVEAAATCQRAIKEGAAERLRIRCDQRDGEACLLNGELLLCAAWKTDLQCGQVIWPWGEREISRSFSLGCDAGQTAACRAASWFGWGDVPNGAVPLLERGCSLGDSSSCLVLAMAYDGVLRDTGLKSNHEMAGQFLTRACAAGQCWKVLANTTEKSAANAH